MINKSDINFEKFTVNDFLANWDKWDCVIKRYKVLLTAHTRKLFLYEILFSNKEDLSS